jgi:Carbonic anhydrase
MNLHAALTCLVLWQFGPHPTIGAATIGAVHSAKNPACTPLFCHSGIYCPPPPHTHTHTCVQVKTIILTGHYNCGAVKAALQLPHATSSLVNCWISDIREARNQAEKELRGLDAEQQLARCATGSGGDHWGSYGHIMLQTQTLLLPAAALCGHDSCSMRVPVTLVTLPST